MSSNITLRDLITTISEVVSRGQEATFIPHGNSMKPMLSNGRDEIILVKPTFPLKKYDLPLYLRQNGTVVLHRVVGIRTTDRGTEYILRGDNTYENEYGIRDKDVVAVVSRFCRRGKWVAVSDMSYRLYVRLWCGCFSLRKGAHWLYYGGIRAAKKAKRMFYKK